MRVLNGDGNYETITDLGVAVFIEHVSKQSILNARNKVENSAKAPNQQTERSGKEFAESLREVLNGIVLPEDYTIEQLRKDAEYVQASAEAQTQDANIPNAQSDADKDFIHELNSNRTLREMCNVVDSHMAKELGFPNVREYRDAVRASILSFKTPPEQPESQQQSEIPEVSLPPEFKLMPQRWPEAVMRWNISKQRHESKLYSITTNGVEYFEARVVKYPQSAQPQWMRTIETGEITVLGIVFGFK